MILYILTLLLLTPGALSVSPPQEEVVDPQLHDELIKFVGTRLNHTLASTRYSLPTYLQISVTLSESVCNKLRFNSKSISYGKTEVIWEEETCGTKRMQKWCYEFPERSITVMKKARDISVMAEFRCASISDDKASTNWKQLIFPCLIVVFIFGIIINFRRFCNEQSEKRKRAQAIKNMIDSSMDTVNLDSSCKENSRKELARFDNDSDPSLGILFTI
ncbi:unnamed protein product [Caenorhabditis brenneri]